MATAIQTIVRPPAACDIFDLDQLINADAYLLKVEQWVSKHRGKLFVDPPQTIIAEISDTVYRKSRSGSGVNLRIAGIDDTVYSEDTEEVDGWGKFYLPQEVKMCVFAVVEDTACSGDQLVLMTCEDRKVYGYDGEDLHEVASDLKELRAGVLKYPASKSYYYGEAFKDMTDEDWAKVRKGPVGQKLDKEHQDMLKKIKPKFLQCLS